MTPADLAAHLHEQSKEDPALAAALINVAGHAGYPSFLDWAADKANEEALVTLGHGLGMVGDQFDQFEFDIAHQTDPDLNVPRHKIKGA